MKFIVLNILLEKHGTLSKYVLKDSLEYISVNILSNFLNFKLIDQKILEEF